MTPVVLDGCFGWLHTPVTGRRNDVGVMLCPGLSQDASTGHRSFRLLANSLSAAGYPALRFDYPGTGDSRDVDDAAYWDAWLDAIGLAADWLRANLGARRIILVGLRFGAALATLVAEQRDDVAGLVLLAPVVKGRAYVSQLATEARLRNGLSLAAGETIEVGELLLTREIRRRMSAVDLAGARIPPGCPVAVFARAETRSLSDCVEYWRDKGTEVGCFGLESLEALLRPTHLTDEPDADFSGIVAWLDQVIPRGPAAGGLLGEQGHSMLHLDGCDETAIVFGAKRQLCGVLCRPTGLAPSDLAVVIGNTGGNPHYGFARFAVEFARTLARSGLASFRIDFAGLGDSRSPTEAGEGLTHVFDVDRTPDMREALNELERLGYRRFAAHGLCSGAYHALHAGVADTRFTALLLVNLPWFTLRHEAAGPSSFARRCLRELTDRQVTTLLMFAEGDAGLKALERHFGQGGLALSGFSGISVAVMPELDHELTGSAMRRIAAERMVCFLLEADRWKPHETDAADQQMPVSS